MSILIKGMEMPKRGHTVTLTITGGGEAVVQYYDCKPQLTVPIVYKAVPVPENEPRWIPVTERLPEEYVDVLCYCSRNNQYGCGEWSKEDNGTIFWRGLYGMIPTHWMPLPEPPEEET